MQVCHCLNPMIRRDAGERDDYCARCNQWHSTEHGSHTVAEGLALQKAALQQMRKPGRNDPCPCGSGKKSKKCCFG